MATAVASFDLATVLFAQAAMAAPGNSFLALVDSRDGSLVASSNAMDAVGGPALDSTDATVKMLARGTYVMLDGFQQNLAFTINGGLVESTPIGTTPFTILSLDAMVPAAQTTQLEVDALTATMGSVEQYFGSFEKAVAGFGAAYTQIGVNCAVNNNALWEFLNDTSIMISAFNYRLNGLYIMTRNPTTGVFGACGCQYNRFNTAGVDCYYVDAQNNVIQFNGSNPNVNTRITRPFEQTALYEYQLFNLTTDSGYIQPGAFNEAITGQFVFASTYGKVLVEDSATGVPTVIACADIFMDYSLSDAVGKYKVNNLAEVLLVDTRYGGALLSSSNMNDPQLLMQCVSPIATPVERVNSFALTVLEALGGTWTQDTLNFTTGGMKYQTLPVMDHFLLMQREPASAVGTAAIGGLQSMYANYEGLAAALQMVITTSTTPCSAYTTSTKASDADILNMAAALVSVGFAGTTSVYQLYSLTNAVGSCGCTKGFNGVTCWYTDPTGTQMNTQLGADLSTAMQWTGTTFAALHTPQLTQLTPNDATGKWLAPIFTNDISVGQSFVIPTQWAINSPTTCTAGVGVEMIVAGGDMFSIISSYTTYETPVSSQALTSSTVLALFDTNTHILIGSSTSAFTSGGGMATPYTIFTTPDPTVSTIAQSLSAELSNVLNQEASFSEAGLLYTLQRVLGSISLVVQTKFASNSATSSWTTNFRSSYSDFYKYIFFNSPTAIPMPSVTIDASTTAPRRLAAVNAWSGQASAAEGKRSESVVRRIGGPKYALLQPLPVPDLKTSFTFPPIPSDITLPPVPSDFTIPPVPSDFTLPPVPSDFTIPPVPSDITLPPVPSDFTIPPVPSDITLPPGFTVPPGVTLPPGFTLPSDITLPPGFTLPTGFTLPPLPTSPTTPTPIVSGADILMVDSLVGASFAVSTALGGFTATGQALSTLYNRLIVTPARSPSSPTDANVLAFMRGVYAAQQTLGDDINSVFVVYSQGSTSLGQIGCKNNNTGNATCFYTTAQGNLITYAGWNIAGAPTSSPMLINQTNDLYNAVRGLPTIVGNAGKWLPPTQWSDAQLGTTDSVMSFLLPAALSTSGSAIVATIVVNVRVKFVKSLLNAYTPCPNSEVIIVDNRNNIFIATSDVNVNQTALNAQLWQAGSVPIPRIAEFFNTAQSMSNDFELTNMLYTRRSISLPNDLQMVFADASGGATAQAAGSSSGSGGNIPIFTLPTFQNTQWVLYQRSPMSAPARAVAAPASTMLNDIALNSVLIRSLYYYQLGQICPSITASNATALESFFRATFALLSGLGMDASAHITYPLPGDAATGWGECGCSSVSGSVNCFYTTSDGTFVAVKGTSASAITSSTTLGLSPTNAYLASLIAVTATDDDWSGSWIDPTVRSAPLMLATAVVTYAVPVRERHGVVTYACLDIALEQFSELLNDVTPQPTAIIDYSAFTYTASSFGNVPYDQVYAADKTPDSTVNLLVDTVSSYLDYTLNTPLAFAANNVFFDTAVMLNGAPFVVLTGGTTNPPPTPPTPAPTPVPPTVAPGGSTVAPGTPTTRAPGGSTNAPTASSGPTTTNAPGTNTTGTPRPGGPTPTPTTTTVTTPPPTPPPTTAEPKYDATVTATLQPGTTAQQFADNIRAFLGVSAGSITYTTAGNNVTVVVHSISAANVTSLRLASAQQFGAASMTVQSAAADDSTPEKSGLPTGAIVAIVVVAAIVIGVIAAVIVKATAASKQGTGIRAGPGGESINGGQLDHELQASSHAYNKV